MTVIRKTIYCKINVEGGKVFQFFYFIFLKKHILFCVGKLLAIMLPHAVKGMIYKIYILYLTIQYFVERWL